MRPRADVTLILEGSYPFVAGGVSSWVHQIVQACDELRFALLHIGPDESAYDGLLYELPENVTVMAEVHCRGSNKLARPRRRRSTPERRGAAASRTLRAIRRLHTEDSVDDDLLDDLAAGDLSVPEFLHGPAAFELLRSELYDRVSEGAPFMDFFWQFRAMHVPLLRLLAAHCPEAAVYHAVSTGYAGLAGAVASWRSGRPLIITEHGIYARERELELARAPWIRDVAQPIGAAMPSPLRRFWMHYFQMLARVAYHRVSRLFTLSNVNRSRQLEDGAEPGKISVVPNGVDPRQFRPRGATPRRGMRVGFVGRVVPIKDIVTLVRACALALEEVELEVWIIGPEDEDRPYARRCRELVESTNLTDRVRFLGPQCASAMYAELDVVLLTSISEGQPLVMLEAFAAGVPVVATDVGACRELIEGRDEGDRALGPAGIVTRVANPRGTAAALVQLARDSELRAQMGESGRARVVTHYLKHQVIDTYRGQYREMATTWRESAGD